MTWILSIVVKNQPPCIHPQLKSNTFFCRELMLLQLYGSWFKYISLYILSFLPIVKFQISLPVPFPSLFLTLPLYLSFKFKFFAPSVEAGGGGSLSRICPLTPPLLICLQGPPSPPKHAIKMKGAPKYFSYPFATEENLSILHCTVTHSPQNNSFGSTATLPKQRLPLGSYTLKSK